MWVREAPTTEEFAARAKRNPVEALGTMGPAPVVAPTFAAGSKGADAHGGTARCRGVARCDRGDGVAKRKPVEKPATAEAAQSTIARDTADMATAQQKVTAAAAAADKVRGLLAGLDPKSPEAAALAQELQLADAAGRIVANVGVGARGIAQGRHRVRATKSKLLPGSAAAPAPTTPAAPVAQHSDFAKFKAGRRGAGRCIGAAQREQARRRAEDLRAARGGEEGRRATDLGDVPARSRHPRRSAAGLGRPRRFPHRCRSRRRSRPSAPVVVDRSKAPVVRSEGRGAPAIPPGVDPAVTPPVVDPKAAVLDPPAKKGGAPVPTGDAKLDGLTGGKTSLEHFRDGTVAPEELAKAHTDMVADNNMTLDQMAASIGTGAARSPEEMLAAVQNGEMPRFLARVGDLAEPPTSLDELW